MQLNCQGCGTVLRLKEEYIGRRVKCPKCGTSQMVPEPEPEPSPYDDDPLFSISADPTPPPVHQSLRPALEQPPIPAYQAGPLAPRSPVSNQGFGSPGYGDAHASGPIVGASGMNAPANTAGGPWGAYQTSTTAAANSQGSNLPEKSWSMSPGKIALGLLMMLGAVVWFVLGLAADRVFFYPPILFILGIASVVKGCLGQTE